MTIESRDQTIEDLKDAVIEAETKTRKMLDRLNKL